MQKTEATKFAKIMSPVLGCFCIFVGIPFMIYMLTICLAWEVFGVKLHIWLSPFYGDAG